MTWFRELFFSGKGRTGGGVRLPIALLDKSKIQKQTLRFTSDGFRIGDEVVNSPVGPGVITSITENNEACVNGVPVLWFETGRYQHDPYHRNKKPSMSTSPFSVLLEKTNKAIAALILRRKK